MRLFVEADSLPELFAGALAGMGEFLLPIDQEKHPKGELVLRHVDIISVDRSALLVEFLSEVLYHASTSHAVFREVRFDALADEHLRATISGRPADGFADDIKAVTYRGADIQSAPDGLLRVTLLFDI